MALDLNGDYVKLGTIKDAIYSHNESSRIDWSASFELPDELALNGPSKKNPLIAKGHDLTIEAGVSVQQQAPRSTNLAYGLGGIKFRLTPKNVDANQFDLRAETTAVAVRSKKSIAHTSIPEVNLEWGTDSTK